MNRTIFITGVIFGILAVVLGAFGAHGLKSMLDADALKTFETGVSYQMYHALFLLVLGSVTKIPEPAKRIPYFLVTLGIVFFSFSIYFLATNGLTTFDFRTIGFVTPLGGLLLITGWGWLGYRCLQHFSQ